MYERVEKIKRNQSRAVANSVAQKMGNVKQGNAFTDNRPDIIKNAGFVANRSEKIIQRTVPMAQNLKPHPTPETGTYVAATGKGEKFNTKDYPRSRFSFGKYTRNEVLEKFPHSKIGNRIVAVKDSASGQMVNVEGIQLDHNFSWDNISSIMNNDGNYSFYEAKMYYNDQSNLHPVLGGLNASAGSSGVKMMEERFPEVNAQIARIQTSWMNLQNFITAKFQECGPIDPQLLFDYLAKIEGQIDSALEY